MDFTHVDGSNKGKVTLYALSTCNWCRMTRDLLTELGISFDYVYVDQLKGKERDKMVDEVKRYNSRVSFPTVLINDKTIVGFREKEIREALKA